MEFEENKDNSIEEPEKTAEETVEESAVESVAEEEPETVEKTDEEPVSDTVPENAPEDATGSEVEEAVVEEATEETAESEPEEETAVEETVESEKDEVTVEEPAAQESDETVSEETAAPELEETVVETAAASELEETSIEETEEPQPDEVADETAEPEIEFERVIPEVVVLEMTEEELADAVEPAEEETADEVDPDNEDSLAELEPLQQDILTEEEQTEKEDPTEEKTLKRTPVKKGKGSLVVKIIGIILLLLLIFIPAAYSLIKGDAFQKELIDQKKALSRTYESVYRKEIFPKLSQMFIPEWAKQKAPEPEPEPQPQGSAQVEPRIPDADQPKDMLDGVPQVPEGLEYYPLYVEDHMIIYGRDNWLYTAGDGGSSLEYFAGTNVLSEEDMAYCAELLNTLDEICRAKGVELVMEVGPNKEQVYPEHFPSVTVENQRKRLLVLEEYLHEHSSAPFVYPIRELAAQKDQYDTYWMYDTHWNSTGSYIGMKAIYAALGRPINDRNAVMRTEDTNRGDLAGITGYTDLYTDYITEYKPNITVETEVYCDWEYDIDDYGKRYISSAQNERKLLVCGDSFRVSLAAHMCKDYKYTDVVHRDIIGLEIPVERLKELTDGDTLVLVCVERWDYYMFGVIPIIIEAMQG